MHLCGNSQCQIRKCQEVGLDVTHMFLFSISLIFCMHKAECISSCFRIFSGRLGPYDACNTWIYCWIRILFGRSFHGPCRGHRSLTHLSSRDSATAQLYRHLAFLLQNITENLAGKYSKSSPNRSKNDAESYGQIYGLHFRSQSLEQTWKMQSTNYVQNEHPTTLTLMPKGCQKGNKIDAKTLEKTLPEHVSENIMKIIGNHVFLNGKIIKVHCKNNWFLRFSRLRARTENASKNTSNMR